MSSRLPVVRPPHRINHAANPVGTGFPQGLASFTWQDDRLTEALDGIITYDDIPDNRCTAYQSPNARDWFGVHFGSIGARVEYEKFQINDIDTDVNTLSLSFTYTFL